jgi:UDP:flavonoid glycosyltransferase YjiC (YdhE family)
MASGTPIVGIATQPEQQMNLEHISTFGAGIRIPCKEWKADKIRQSVLMILSDSNYKKRALSLKKRIDSTDGGSQCAHEIWNVLANLPKA